MTARCLVDLHLHTDEWGPHEHDTAETAAAVLAPLIGEQG